MVVAFDVVGTLFSKVWRQRDSWVGDRVGLGGCGVVGVDDEVGGCGGVDADGVVGGECGDDGVGDGLCGGVVDVRGVWLWGSIACGSQDSGCSSTHLTAKQTRPPLVDRHE
jgi:hypothetical protein